MAYRAETGAMRFGDDWTGVFIRGDNAFGYSISLRNLIDAVTLNDKYQKLDVAVMLGLLELLQQSNEHGNKEQPQQLKDFNECLTPQTEREE